MADQHMALGVLVHATGSHPASWLKSEAPPDASTSIDYYRRLATLAETGLLDLFFIADTPAARTEKLNTYARYPLFMNCFEPITLLSALSGSTTHIGLGATASTSFYEPYNLARQFASLDHLSHGACRLERGDLRERLCRAQLRPRQAAAARPALCARARILRGRSQALGYLGRRRVHQRQGTVQGLRGPRNSTPPITRASSSP